MPDQSQLVSELIDSCRGTVSEDRLQIARERLDRQDCLGAVDCLYEAIVAGKLGISSTIWEKFKACVSSIPGADRGQRVRALLQDHVLMDRRP
jgi:hypothetical protein